MKTYQTFILLILISYIYSRKSYCDYTKTESSPSKAEDCSKGTENGGHCCFIKRKSDNVCGGFGPNEYKYIPDTVKLNKKCYDNDEDDCIKFDDYSIDCKSSYLVFSSIMIILLFL